MVRNESEVVDMVFKQKLEQQQRIKKLRRKRRRRRFIVIMTIVGLVSFYFFTDFSKPHIISVKGNQIVGKDEILSTANINLDSNLIYANPLLIKSRLKKHPMISSVSVNSSLFSRIINIDVKEIEVFGYRQDTEGANLILFDGTSKELTNDLYKFLPNLLYVEGFSEVEDQKRLVESFSNVDSTVMAQISELHQTAVSYDEKLLEIWMNDGNKVYTSFQTVDRLNYYFEIIVNLDNNNRCIYIDELSGEAYSQPCENN